MIKNKRKEMFKNCKRNTYTEGCLDEMNVLKNKIKEALKHFLNEVSCEDCSYYKELSNSIESTVNLMIDTLLDDTSNLINEQEKEIDRLTQVAQEAQKEAYEAAQRQFIEQVNQAKIDVLTELKEKAISLSAIETYHICNLVDEMIKELKK